LEDPVNGLHVIFSGTQGTLTNGTITVGSPGRLTVSDNQVNIFLKGALAPGMMLCFRVTSESEPITVHTALWSMNYNIVGTAEVISSK
jgi:hypothetical protein